MSRPLTKVGVCAIVALAVGACGTGMRHTVPRRAADTYTRHKQIRLSLAAGRATARYEITAPSPASYGFNISATAPGSLDLDVYIHTWYGANFTVFPSTSSPKICTKRQGATGAEEACFARFPRLPAQYGGRWAIVASKQSGPSVTTHLTITFVRNN